jgi:hypothetical protein
MSKFSIDLNEVAVVQEHSLTDEQKKVLTDKFNALKHKVETEGYEMTLDDQRLVIEFLRADRETKFILNQKPAKVVREKAVREPKVKKPKKLTQKALGLIIMKELNKEELTEEEARNKHFTLTGEVI